MPEKCYIVWLFTLGCTTPGFTVDNVKRGWIAVWLPSHRTMDYGLFGFLSAIVCSTSCLFTRPRTVLCSPTWGVKQSMSSTFVRQNGTVTCHQQPRPGAPPPDLQRLQRVPRHEKLWNYVTWPAWENSNVFLFNWCLYSSEISDCKSP